MLRAAVTIMAVIAMLGTARMSECRLVVNEIMGDPASDWNGDSTYSYREDEWVEIYNAGLEPVDLAAYWMSDSDSTLLFNFCGILDPGGHRVVCGSEVVEWQRANGVTAAGLRLNNSGDTVMLWMLGAGRRADLAPGDPGENVSDMILIDSFTYSSHEAEDDRSTGLMPDGGPSHSLFDGLNPYTGSQEPQGSGCVPTPGGSNGCATPVEERSWGSVKVLYRQ